jgi:hypothetical protein
MSTRPSGRRSSDTRRALRAPLVAALLAYAVLLAGSAVLHHDIACHQTSRTHCTACTWAQLAAGVQSDEPGTLQLHAAGAPHGAPIAASDTLLIPRSPGRSPPLV